MTSRRNVLLGMGAAPVLGGALALAERATRQGFSFLGSELSPRERIQKYGLPNVELTAHTGQRLRFYDDLVKDRKVVINFLYATCKGICVPVTSRLVEVQRLLDGRVGRDIFFYSLTLEPEKDTPEVLRQFAADHKVGPGWLFLTGAPADLESLRRGLGFFDLDPAKDADTSNHVGMLRYGVESSMRWGSCPGLSRPEHIVRSILWDLEPPTAMKDT
jgi:protein SCO1